MLYTLLGRSFFHNNTALIVSKIELVNGRLVDGLDATTAQTFGTLYNKLNCLGCELVITHLQEASCTYRLLAAHHVVGEGACRSELSPAKHMTHPIRDLHRMGYLVHV